MIVFVISMFSILCFSRKSIKQTDKKDEVFATSIKNIESISIIDTIINDVKINVKYSSAFVAYYINFNNQIYDTCFVSPGGESYIKAQPFLINDAIETNFIYDYPFFIMAMPLRHVNTYTTITSVIDLKNNTFTYCHALDFYDILRYSDKSQYIMYKYFTDYDDKGHLISKEEKIKLKNICK